MDGSNNLDLACAWCSSYSSSGLSYSTFSLFSFLINLMYILGISAYYHDSAACLILDGKVVAAAQEERFTRIKHDSSFPYKAIQYLSLIHI